MKIKQMPLHRYLKITKIMINFLISYYVCIRNNFYNLLETFFWSLSYAYIIIIIN